MSTKTKQARARGAAVVEQAAPEQVEQQVEQHAVPTGALPNPVKWQVSALKKAEYNPRKITKVQSIELGNSIDKFGIVEPLVVNVNPERYGTVIGGHQRLSIYKDRGITEVDAIEVNLSLADEKELNLRLNRNTGDWDTEALSKFFSREELKFVGFLDSELSGLFDNDNKSTIGDAFAKTEEPQYPINAMVDEAYDGVLIFCELGVDMLWLGDYLELPKVKSYKCDEVGVTRVLKVGDFRQRVEEKIAREVERRMASAKPDRVSKEG